jgi:TolB-like protein/class 3 adenylate cyclase/Flp pilus assembly protein TadD
MPTAAMERNGLRLQLAGKRRSTRRTELTLSIRCGRSPDAMAGDANALLTCHRSTIVPPSCSASLIGQDGPPGPFLRWYLCRKMTLPKPAVPTTPLPFGTVTFLFTDIVGSTVLWEAQGEEMRVSLARHDALLRQCIVEGGGYVVKTTGDGFHAAFTYASDAIAVAIACQKALHAEPWPPAAQIRVRMALHTGAAELRDGDYYGSTVNRAARLAALGHGGQTLLSAVTHDLCCDNAPSGVTFSLLGEHKLRGLTRREAVYEVCHPDLPQAFPPLQTLLAPIDDSTRSIAVLPFTDLSRDKSYEYFADGLAEELLNVLSRIRGVRVASRTSAFSFKATKLGLPSVARELNVETVLEGSVRIAGNRVRVGAHLIDTKTDSQLWSQSYDRELDDIFAVQDDIAQAVVAELRTELLRGQTDATAYANVKAEVQTATIGRGKDAVAYELYLRGRYCVDRFTPDDAAAGIEFYLQAVALDPRFALAWAWLARAYADQAAYAWAPAAEAFERARDAAERSLQMNPDLAEGHAVLGLCRLAKDGNWRGAEASFRRALELAPGNALVLRHAAMIAACLGRDDESIALLRRAVTLDPLSVPVLRLLGQRCLYAGLLADAERAFQKVAELNPRGGFTNYWLGMTHLANGRRAEALSMFKLEVNEVFSLLGLVVGENALGHRPEAEAALHELIARHAGSAAFQIAGAHAFAGNADGAFEWLERAEHQRDPGLVELKAEILLRNLYDDPRWPALLERKGLQWRPVH